MTGLCAKPIRIQSLARASAILDTLAEARGDWVALYEVSRRIGLGRTTVHNLIASLAVLGFVEQHATSRRYRLGLRNLQLGQLVYRRLDIARAARPSLIRLARQTNETASLAVPYGFEVLVIDSLEGNHGIRVAADTGKRMPFHASACGKSILAHLPAAERQAIIAGRPLVAFTPHTIQDADALEQELVRTRARGYATNVEEVAEGAVCVAAPVFGPFGEALGAISIDAPSSRLRTELIPEVASRLMEEAVNVTEALGSAGADDDGIVDQVQGRRTAPRRAVKV
jgi:IclR family acetate operon transcriptional repressor